ncbi:glycine betaine ABC transporter substrate-binding protein [Paenibacillus eucommiae]|uniref:Osmoprotectant transport system substrate-binding protein n=1 Tax=Paenibacillus eucommiae TaxID=1355755 RepID=A0ABS4J5Q3_9BACL|nr:glycine betaine ABC transporter substrate-binding protein [Paenibacillus eucommiae]MBP1995181.1 osmoprotectant transport system substrate-binding protein [Paenibacillus eucommiae]
MKSIRKMLIISMVCMFVVVAAACGNNSNTSSGDKPTIKVGAKAFTEQYIIGELYSQALEEAGYKVKRSLNLAGTQIAFEALKKGDIDLYPEYTGTALMDVLKGEVMTDTQTVYDEVKKQYKQWDIELLDRTSFNNTYVMVTTKEVAEKYNLKTLSDLAAAAKDLTFAIIPEVGERPDGLPGLQKLYGGFKFKATPLFDGGLKYKALQSKEADVTIGFGTDGQIAGLDLVSLEDDKKFWPPYQVATQIRGETLKNNPEVGEIINKINALLTSEVMTNLNWKADGDAKEEPKDIAKEFLKENGLIK